MKEETARWVEMSEADQQAAQVLLNEGLFAATIFHCQQAVEKLLKALWVERIGGVPPRTHNLLDLARELGEAPEGWQSFLRELSFQAVASRYSEAGAYPSQTAATYYERTAELCEVLRLLLN